MTRRADHHQIRLIHDLLAVGHLDRESSFLALGEVLDPVEVQALLAIGLRRSGVKTQQRLIARASDRLRDLLGVELVLARVRPCRVDVS